MKKYLSFNSTLVLFCFCYFFLVTLSAQTIPEVSIIKSPEAYAIDKAIEIPVSNYTGIPNISIPLYEIKIKGVSVPISINYHAGGIRTDQESTFIGLGWSLEYGGQISRSVKGKADERSFIKAASDPAFSNYSISSFLSLPNFRQDAWLRDRTMKVSYAKTEEYKDDYRPDEFHYSSIGYSGRFMFNQANNKFVFFPKDDIKVQHNFSTTQPQNYDFHPIESWDMVLPSGVSLKFGEDGTSSVGVWNGMKTTNSWGIKKITNNFKESINYYYNSLSYTINNILGDFYSYKNRTVTTNPWTPYNYSDAMLQSITFPNGSINFVTSDREDLPNGSKKLDEIQIINAHGEVIKRIHFYYSYFYGDFGDISLSNHITGNSDDVDHKRLRLNSITIKGKDSKELTYQFDYYTYQFMPSKRSYAQDFWGYFNRSNGNTWVPKIWHNQELSGDRSVNNDYNKVFSLKSVTYPTGGKTEFFYEGNTAKITGATAVLRNLNSSSLVPDGRSIYLYGATRSDYGGLVPDEIGEFGQKYFRKTFTIPLNGGKSRLNGWNCSTTYFQNNTEDNTLDCYNNNVEFILEKINSTGPPTLVKRFRARDCSAPIGQQYLGSEYDALDNLSKGDYRMSIVIWNSSSNNNHGHVTTFTLSWSNPSTDPAQQNIDVGGLRIKDIKYFEKDGTLAKQKSYSYTDLNSSVTSGKIISLPTFIQNYWNYDGNTDIRLYGTPIYPLQTTSGSYLGYETVTETLVGKTSAEDLITQYGYTFKEPKRDFNYDVIDQGILESYDWQRGKLKRVRYLKAGTVIRDEEYYYNELSPHVLSLENEDYVEEINVDLISKASLNAPYFDGDFFYYYVIDPSSSTPLLEVTYRHHVDNYFFPYDVLDAFPSGADLSYISPYNVTLPYYRRYTGFDKPLNKKITVIDEHGNAIVETVNYFYDRTPTHYQLTRTESANSKEEALKSEVAYVSDFLSTSPYDLMFQKNMVNIPIQQTESKRGIFIQSLKTDYKVWTNGMIAPSKVQIQNGNNAAETRFEYLLYDGAGNPLLSGKSEDAPTSYLYGYDNQYVIAEAQNVLQSDIAYTSFEDHYSNLAQGNWQLTGTAQINDPASPFGKFCYRIEGSVYMQKTGLNQSTTYMISYWSKNGSYQVTGSSNITTGKTINGWTYYVHSVVGVSMLQITGTGYIDEVKLYPKTAKMITYVYIPLIGISSVTDPNNIALHYEYDSQNRLKIIKDNDGNVMKFYEYHYINGN